MTPAVSFSTKRSHEYFCSSLVFWINASVRAQSPSLKVNVTCTWMGGSNYSNAPAIYGVPVAFSADPSPGARSTHCSVSLRSSGSDMYYIYGGSLLGVLVGDLWALDISTGYWATIHSSWPRSLGTPGSYGSSVFPGRMFTQNCANLGDDGFYLFGGYSSEGGTNNFMWHYRADQILWKFVVAGGTQVYNFDPFTVGLNIEDPRNIPAGRYEATMCSLPSVNSLLLWGGWSYNPSIIGTLSDTWRFNATSEQWAWLHGNYTKGTASVYGQIGFFAPGNVPSSRFAAVGAVADGTQSMYLFSGTNNVGDTWVFDYPKLQWACLYAGSSAGTYGSVQMPGGRIYHRMVALPGTPLLVMIAGYGNGNLGGSNQLSDIWVFNTTSTQWTWVRGEESSNVGNYGTKGVSNSRSLPIRRTWPSFSYAANLGKIVLHGGGTAAGSTDDLWYLDFGINLAASTSTITTKTSSSSAVLLVTSLLVSVKSMTSNKPVATNADTYASGPEILANYTSMIGYAAFGLLFFMIVSLGCLVWRLCVFRNLKRHENSMSMFSGNTFNTPTTMAVIASAETTMLNNQTEMAVPGFLKFHAGAEFRWHKRIAKGGGGEVFLGDALIPKLAMFGETIIVKIVAPDRAYVSQKTADAFDQEVSVMYYLGRHENIAGLLGWCDQPLAMLMKFYGHGALDKFSENGGVLTNFIRISFLLDISRGVEFMHSKSVAHCDIKPANVLVDTRTNGELFCALTDFGIARVYSDSAQLVHAFQVVNLRGLSIAYAAPEVLKGFRSKVNATKEMAFAGDVYSFAVVTSFLLVGKSQWN